MRRKPTGPTLFEKAEDWRMGLNISPIYRNHFLFGQVGMVTEVHPDGHKNIKCPNGVLEISMDDFALFDAADNWRTA